MQKLSGKVNSGSSKSKSSESQSMGYPALEALLDVEKPDLSGMLSREEQLVQMSKARGIPEKQKTAARHAALAYDKFFAVFSALLELKQKMLTEINPKSSSKPPTKKK